jgi:hypothetical protein
MSCRETLAARNPGRRVRHPQTGGDPLLEPIRAALTYANVTATVALFLALAASTREAKNLIGGSLSPNSVGSTWYLAGTSIDLPSCGSCETSLSPSGTGTFGSTQNSANDQLSPDATIIASELSVHVDVAPGNRTSGAGGGVATRTFVLFSRSDPSHGLRCDISGSDTTCNSGAQTITIPPGSRLLVDAANSGGAQPTKAQFSWRAIAQ